MTDLAQYDPGPASPAQVQKDGDKWTLVLVRELRHSPEKVWQAITDPAHLREWAPFDADGNLSTAGSTVKLTWVGTGAATETRVTRADAPEVLEYGDIRWGNLKPWVMARALRCGEAASGSAASSQGWGAAGWHICFDVLDRLLSGTPIGRMAGGEAMKVDAWQRLTAGYAKQFGIETPNWPPKAAQKSWRRSD